MKEDKSEFETPPILAKTITLSRKGVERGKKAGKTKRSMK